MDVDVSHDYQILMFGSSSVSRSVNWSMKLILLKCCSVPCCGWYIPIMVWSFDPSCVFQMLCLKQE